MGWSTTEPCDLNTKSCELQSLWIERSNSNLLSKTVKLELANFRLMLMLPDFDKLKLSLEIFSRLVLKIKLSVFQTKQFPISVPVWRVMYWCFCVPVLSRHLSSSPPESLSDSGGGLAQKLPNTRTSFWFLCCCFAVCVCYQIFCKWVWVTACCDVDAVTTPALNGLDQL